MIQPLFEEYNRCRRLLCQMARRLDDEGVGTTLADLSGMGESLTSIDTVSLAQWHLEAETFIKDVEPTIIASIRGGALIDDIGRSKGHWRFAPESGARIVRDLRRTALTGNAGLYGGHKLSAQFLADLEAAEPKAVETLRTVRLEGDAQAADAKLPGSPLWRRAEPGHDDVMAAAMATDLAEWTRHCAAR